MSERTKEASEDSEPWWGTEETWPERTRRMVAWVLATEVSIEISEPLDTAWLVDNVGRQRAFHPMMEAQQGYFDFFEGEWAVQTSGEWRYFWFSRKKHAALFLLMFGGRSSVADAERMRLLDPQTPFNAAR